MNIYAPKDNNEHLISWEFRGKPWKRGPYTWLKAEHRIINLKWFYCFEINNVVCKTSYDIMVKE